MPRFAANLSMLFGEKPFLDRFAAAKAAGFAGVEYLFPYEFDKADLRERLDEHGLTQVLHNLRDRLRQGARSAPLTMRRT